MIIYDEMVTSGDVENQSANFRLFDSIVKKNKLKVKRKLFNGILHEYVCGKILDQQT